MNSPVALVTCVQYRPDMVRSKVEEGLELLGGIRKFIKPEEKILLKPNLLAPDPPETATATHPVVFESVARILIDYGADVCYGDSPSFASLQRALKKSGIYDVAEKLNLKIADFENKERIFFKEALQNKVFDIARGALNSDGIVSLPKLKTHGLTLLTGAIKNQFGCIPGLTKSGFHAKLEDIEKFAQMLVDLTMFLRPRLYIMDGIRAMEGNGPRRGNPVDLGVLLLSPDPVALDTVASRIIGLDPRKVIPTVKGELAGLGTMVNVDVRGKSIADVVRKFQLPRHSEGFKSLPPFIRRFLKKILVQFPVINRKKCVKCHECFKICPSKPKSIKIRHDNYPEHTYDSCIRCYCCQETCPESAITIKYRLV
jgi:uncharacterized protein (DUF362 family)/Pyruvate/2-oxoacid:ferredoxin oxidoreductase delta subunit